MFNLTALELVYLRKNQTSDVINGVANQLIQLKKIAVMSDNRLMVKGTPIAENAMEFCVLQTLGAGRVVYRDLLRALELKPAFNKTARAMDGFNTYFSQSQQFIKLFMANFIALSIVFVLGAVRLITGLMRDKPVTIIAAMVAVCLIVTIVYLYYLTVSIGSVALPRFYKKNILPGRPVNDEWDWEYFLSGSAVFVAAFAPLIISNNNGGGGDGGSGSSCGSGDGGGGSCGGCGGN